jgi:hypothetical protein
VREIQKGLTRQGVPSQGAYPLVYAPNLTTYEPTSFFKICS